MADEITGYNFYLDERQLARRPVYADGSEGNDEVLLRGEWRRASHSFNTRPIDEARAAELAGDVDLRAPVNMEPVGNG